MRLTLTVSLDEANMIGYAMGVLTNHVIDGTEPDGSATGGKADFLARSSVLMVKFHQALNEAVNAPEVTE